MTVWDEFFTIPTVDALRFAPERGLVGVEVELPE
jgi:hypothetical protein